MARELERAQAHDVVESLLDEQVFPRFSQRISERQVERSMQPLVPQYCSNIFAKTVSAAVKACGIQLYSFHSAQVQPEPNETTKDSSLNFKVRVKRVKRLIQKPSIMGSVKSFASRKEIASIHQSKFVKQKETKFVSLECSRQTQPSEPWEDELRSKLLQSESAKRKLEERARAEEQVNRSKNKEAVNRKVAYDQFGNMLICKEIDHKKYPVLWWNVASRIEECKKEQRVDSVLLNPPAQASSAPPPLPEPKLPQKEALINQFFKPVQGSALTIFKTNGEVLYQSQCKRVPRSFQLDNLFSSSLQLSLQQYRLLKLNKDKREDTFQPKRTSKKPSLVKSKEEEDLVNFLNLAKSESKVNIASKKKFKQVINQLKDASVLDSPQPRKREIQNGSTETMVSRPQPHKHSIFLNEAKPSKYRKLKQACGHNKL